LPQQCLCNESFMPERVRVHILAKELGLGNKELVSLLSDAGHEVKSHLAGIDVEVAEQIRQQFQNGNGSTAAVEAAEHVPQPEPDADKPEPAKEQSADAAKAKGSKNSRKERQDKSVKSRVFTAPAPQQTGEGQELHLKPPIIVKDLAEAMAIKPADLIRELLTMNVFASINQSLDTALAQRVADKHGFKMITDKRQKSSTMTAKDEEQPENAVFDDEEVEARSPVVAFLGHVDHGKTSLQDFIRKTNVTEGEAGGITQHIGATNIEWQGHKITMIDTPGHEAFASMRARGANSTDIVVLVIAANDGFMPQTIEALNHARDAKVPIVVALNKIDLENADIDRVLMNMQQNDMMPEPWGGEFGVCNVSAMTGEGIDGLLERLVLEAEMLELKCNSELPVRAYVLESQLESSLGPTANILIKNGTIKVGDVVICGQYYGKVKALFDCRGTRIESAGPSMPVKVVGLSGVPDSGAVMAGCKNERQARRLTAERGENARKEQLTSTRSSSIEDLFNEIEQENRKELKAILRSDVQGTCEAVIDGLNKLQSDKIDVDLVLSGVGAVTENDVILASASNALIIGFHVRVNPGVNALAKREGVTIMLFSVIYELIEQIRNSLEGMLDPVVREENLGRAQILQVFTMSKSAGKICGCTVSKGIVKVGAHARVHRKDELIYNGTISSLRHFTDDVKEVRQGFECGILLDNFTDFDVNDIIEVYEYKESRATL
jgi:translation initiation factor IF-2